MRGRPARRFLGEMTTPRRPGESLLQILVGIFSQKITSPPGQHSPIIKIRAPARAVSSGNNNSCNVRMLLTLNVCFREATSWTSCMQRFLEPPRVCHVDADSILLSWFGDTIGPELANRRAESYQASASYSDRPLLVRPGLLTEGVPGVTHGAPSNPLEDPRDPLKTGITH
jgi:hypothetical protein